MANKDGNLLDNICFSKLKTELAVVLPISFSLVTVDRLSVWNVLLTWLGTISNDGNNVAVCNASGMVLFCGLECDTVVLL